jgi:alpha-L-fucosidase
MADLHETLKTAACPPGKRAVKKGLLDIGIVETTPIVWKGRLLRCEWIRNLKLNDVVKTDGEHGYHRFTDMETEAHTPPFALNHSFGSAHVEGDTAYVYAVDGEEWKNHKIDVFYSKDLENWERRTAIDFPDTYTIFNTSVCKGPDGYVMAIEIGAPKEVAGNPFTIIFARSENLLDWTLMPTDKCVYTRSRYSACPTIRFCDGFYYIIYLEGLPLHRWLPYIVRTGDFKNFEPGLINPIMCFDDEDKTVLRPEKFTAAELDFIKNAVNCNNSDVDICEFEGKTVILYSWGNQFGKEFLAYAEYAGSMEEYLKSFY